MLLTLWDNRRVKNLAMQILLFAAFAGLLYWLWSNTSSNLAARGIRVGFEYLDRQANFPISESVLPFDPSDTFGWAYAVGVANTAAISLIAIVASTLLGLVIALVRLSRNPLASNIAAVFVGGVRNMPLISASFLVCTGNDVVAGTTARFQSAPRRLPLFARPISAISFARRLRRPVSVDRRIHPCDLRPGSKTRVRFGKNIRSLGGSSGYRRHRNYAARARAQCPGT